MITNTFSVWSNGAPVVILATDGSFGVLQTEVPVLDQVAADPTFTRTSFSSKRLAAAVFTAGLTEAETQTLYNLVKTMRSEMEAP